MSVSLRVQTLALSTIQSILLSDVCVSCVWYNVDFCVGCIQGHERHNWAFIRIQDTAASVAAQNPCLSCCEPMPCPLETSVVVCVDFCVRCQVTASASTNGMVC